MAETKKRISEYNAALMFTQSMINCAINAWPTVNSNIQIVTSNKGRLIVASEEQAVFDLMLASSALDMQAVKNLFPNDQALRLEQLVYRLGISDKYGNYAEQQLKRYGDEFQKELAKIEQGGNPADIVSAFLLYRLFGNKLEQFTVKGTREGMISPLLIDAVTDVLLSPFSGVGTWKKIHDNFVLDSQLA